jgi:3-deoxy-D-arabino-heptulosonate 7-phosphate (DAHP) synthase
VHPDPKVAKSDASQQLDFETFTGLMNGMRKIAEVVGRTLI